LENLTEMPKDVLEVCILEIIGRGETYGYEIAKPLNELSFSEVVEETVYTILLRLEKNQLINAEKRTSTVGAPRKLFTLNDAGQKKPRYNHLSFFC
jgi:PadR family transcriptional regulator PadR